MQRRTFLRVAFAGVAGAAVGVPLSACGAGSPSDPRPGPARSSRPARSGRDRILLAYFSRPGENHWNGGRKNLKVGNTEVLARTVRPLTTHAMSGLGTTPDDYARSCRGARIGTGLAVRGEEVRSAGMAVDTWLRRTALLGAQARRDE
jgi:hypothetical protein